MGNLTLDLNKNHTQKTAIIPQFLKLSRTVPATKSLPTPNNKTPKRSNSIVRNDSPKITKRSNSPRNSQDLILYRTISAANLAKILKNKVEQAIKDKKTFTVCGNYYSVRRALLSRGWIEKLYISYNTYDRDNLQRLLGISLPELIRSAKDPLNGKLYKRVICSKMLGTVGYYYNIVIKQLTNNNQK